MLKGLGINPHINQNSTLAEIEAEMDFATARAEELDWEMSKEDHDKLMALLRLARAKGSKKSW